MKKIILIIASFLVLAHTESVYSQISGTYAIVNCKTGLSLRPKGASSMNGNKIIMFATVEWKCETWSFKPNKDHSYTLENLYTGKSFQPENESGKPGTNLIQLPRDQNDIVQRWIFVEDSPGFYRIRHLATGLYLTTTESTKNNSDVFLEKKNKIKEQLWKIVAQSPQQ